MSRIHTFSAALRRARPPRRLPRRPFLTALLATSWLTAGSLTAGCMCSGNQGQPDEKLAGLVVAPKATVAPIAPDRAASDPDEFLRAITTPHRRLAQAIGPHSFAGTSKARIVEDGNELETLDDVTRIRVDGKGNFHAELENSRDYGRDVYLLDGTLYIRPRYGKYHRRPPTDDSEPLQIRDDIFATLGAYYEVVAASAAVEDKGETTYQGRRARTIALSQARKPRDSDAPATATGDHQAWRGAVVVEKIAGEVVIDAQTGAPLRGNLDTAVQFVRDGRTFRMELAATHEVTDIGAAGEPIAPPDEEQVVDTPRRHHEVIERDELLEGIAPPARVRRRKGAL